VLSRSVGYLAVLTVHQLQFSLQAAIANLRPATMELGGKSSLIIFDDAGRHSTRGLGIAGGI
jgi:hypothetical protein